MAAQIQGAWRRQYIGETTALQWGTGVNPIHYEYGTELLRTKRYPIRTGEITPPKEAVSDVLLPADFWGYQPEDSLYTGMEYDARPSWGDETAKTVVRATTGDQPSWAAPGPVTESFRTRVGGAYRKFRGRSTAYSNITYQVPSETVSEGWENKQHGMRADAKPSDPSQYERQTSMQQRYAVRNNAAAVVRGTDAAREKIGSLVTGQKLKIYSGGQRHYDMLPKAQDQMIRPFWYRTAGTGRVAEMVPNTLWSIQAVERIPPADPSLGPPETELGSSYGYTNEDGQYYA